MTMTRRLNLEAIVARLMVVMKPVILSCISFMFIEIKFMYCHSFVIFIMNSSYNMLIRHDNT